VFLLAGCIVDVVDIYNRQGNRSKMWSFGVCEISSLLGGGLEPHLRVLFSAVFHSIAQGNFHQSGKQWNIVETKPLQTAASLGTRYLLVISDQTLKPLIPFLAGPGHAVP
jgi:hypothetical protein